MRILWIKTELLHPVDKGGRIRTFQMLRELAKEHEITYLALHNEEDGFDAVQQASEYASRVIRVPFRATEKGLNVAFLWDLFCSVLSPLPYAIYRYRSEVMRRHIQRLDKETDLIVCDFLAPAINVPDGLSTPVVLFQHNDYPFSFCP